MFKLPGVTTSGVRVRVPTETVDIFPTLVDFAFGGEKRIPTCSRPNDPSQTTCSDGLSLRPLIADPTTYVKPFALSVYNRGIPRAENDDDGVDGDDGDGDDGDRRQQAGQEHQLVGLREVPGGVSSCLTATSPVTARTGCAMGYSMLTAIDGHEVRYTEWVHFPGPGNNFQPVWETLYATELYNHTEDPGENVNRFDDMLA